MVEDIPDEFFEAYRNAYAEELKADPQQRELNLTQDALASDVFERLWEYWKGIRTYSLDENDEMIQVPMHRPGYPDSRDDCDVILSEYRRKVEDVWQEGGRLLRLEWARNLKEGCDNDQFAWLVSIGDDTPDFVDSLSPAGREVLEKSRQKIQQVVWQSIY